MLKWLTRLRGSSSPPAEHGGGLAAFVQKKRTDAWMREAYKCHRGGKLGRAEALYRRILEADPDNADALYLLGEICRGSGRNEEAIERIGKAIGVNGEVAAFHFSSGCALQAAGRHERARASYRRAVELDPTDAEAWNNLGGVEQGLGRLAEAEGCYRRALASKGGLAQAHFNLGGVLRALGRIEEAIGQYRRALELDPRSAKGHEMLGNALMEMQRPGEAAEAYRNGLARDPRNAQACVRLGVALQEQGRLAEAAECYGTAVGIDPGLAEAHYNLGCALLGQDRLEQAEQAYRRALEVRPGYAEAAMNLGVVVFRADRSEEALEWYRRALALDPGYPEAHLNLGYAQAARGEFVAAYAAYDLAIGLRPDFAEAHWNRAMVDLLEGEYERGWEGYEWRWRMEPLLSQARRYVRPRWDGAPTPGQTVLLYGEQGFGDLLQFVRYVPLLAGRCVKVLLLCHRDLRRLFESVAGVSAVVDEGGQMPEHDVRLPLLSAAYLLGTRLETIPREVPYLRAPRECVQRWDELMAGQAGRCKVGLVWSGSVANRENYARRSLGLSMLGPLAGVEGVTFFSLQKGAGAEQAASAPVGMRLVDVTGELKDFADTAGLIERLDLVVTVDTAVAHLAGALGKPVWVLLPYVPDWRWLLGRTDSPWYPTMRLFRQQALGEWDGAIEEVAVALNAWVERGGA